MTPLVPAQDVEIKELVEFAGIASTVFSEITLSLIMITFTQIW